MSERSLPISDLRESVPAVDADQAAALAEGLSELELPFRATLELRYRRGLPDSTIAAVAQTEESEIVRQRSRALVWLAQRAGIEGPDAIDAVEGGLTMLWEDGPPTEPESPAEEPAAAAVPPPQPRPESEPEPDAPPKPEARTERPPLAESVPPPSVPPPVSRNPALPLPTPKPFPSPRSKSGSKPGKPKAAGESNNRRLIALLALAAAAAVLFIVITSGGSDEAPVGGAAPATPPSTTTSKGGKAPSGPVTMQMLPGVDTPGSIEVTMSGDPATPDLDMKLHGLPDPDGEYRAWLYKSVIDSRSLGKARKGDGEVKVTLPEGWQDYPYLDISIQDPGSIAHSGESVSRISTADLPQP